MRPSKLLRGIPLLSFLFCATAGFGQNPAPTPVPLITQVTPPSLSPAAIPPGSNNFTLTILGANFAPGDLVELSAPVGGPNPPTAIAFNPTVNATGTQMVANFTNVFLPLPGTLTVKVTRRANTGAPLLASNAYYLPVTPSNPTVLLEAPVTSFLQNDTKAMATADFNGDGLPDLAVISQGPSGANAVTILTGGFLGSFTTGASYPTGNAPSGIVAADFDGDHIVDLAVTNAMDNTVMIFLGNGDGTFRPGTIISDPGVYPTQIVAADFNGDGHMDLAVLNSCGTGQNGCYPVALPLGPENVAILLGNGDGTFNVAPTMPATGFVSATMAAADLNQDGFIDLIVANSSNNLTLLMGNGDGTFTAASSTPSTGFSGPPLGIAVGDFNGDGAPDVAVSNSGDNAIFILLNQCAGLPAPQCTLTPKGYGIGLGLGASPGPIATADMNGDGFLDLVVGNSGNGTVSVLLGDGTGNFNPLPWPNQSFPAGGSPQALALLDFTQDGRLDVLTLVVGGYSKLQQEAVMQVTLTTNNGIPFYGQFLQLTATLNPPFGQPMPTGTVTFYDGSTSLGSAVLSGYQAIFQFGTLPTGNHQITAVYSGDGNFLSSTSNAVTEIVTKAQTTATLGTNVNMVAFGQPFTLTATIQPQSLGTPTGTVDFVEIYTSKDLGSASLVNGVAQLTLSNLSPGAHVITAIYNGDSNFTGSQSPTYQENITQASTTIAVATSASPVLLGQTPTFTATVQPSASTAATGLALFFADGSPTPIGSASVTNNTAQLRAPVLPVGPHSITAQYGGDTNYTGSTSSPILEMVNPSADTVTVSGNPIVYGQQATFVATVQGVSYSGTPTGTITFADGSANLGIATLSNGSAQFTTSALLMVGPHAITASYSGDANFQPATSSQFTENVGKANTTTAVTSAQNPSSFGQPVQLTATVQPAFGGAATGNVTFYDGSQSLGTSPLSNNTAALGVSNFTVGAHSITASYVGDSNVNGSASAAVTQTVNPSPTSVTVTSNANPSIYGQNVTFSATAQAAFGTAPPSTISFYDGTTLLGTFNSVTAAQITVSTFTGGTRSITAQYAGNSNFASSTSAVLTQTVNPASTTTTVSSNLNPSSFGQPVVLTAVVDSTYHLNSNGGTVTFFDIGVAIGSSAIAGNAVNLTISSLGTGAHSITANYGGDSNLSASASAAFTQTVNQAAVSPTIALSAYAITYGQTLTMTSNVRPAYGGTPTGTVTFWLNSTTPLGTGTVVNGTAQATTTAVPVGSRSIFATYNGDSNFASGSSASTQLTVSQANTTTVASADLNPVNYGQTVTLSATVQTSGGTPTGSVTFLDGTTTLGTATLTNGVAQLSVSTFGGGTHSITAKYSGDANLITSTSTVFTEMVNLLPTTTTVASSLNPATFGQAVTLTATVQAGSGVSVAGTITFLDGSLGLGTVTVANSSAQLTTSTLAPGAHTLTAVYNSNGNFAASTSSALTETVNQLTTTTTLTSNANPASAGQNVTFTATVQAGAGNSPVGSVTFLDGSTTLGSTAVINNSAQLTISTLALGSHSITAAYSGSTDFAASTSSALTETVNQSSTTTTLVSNLNPATFGQGVPFVATVQTASGGAATGTVTFFDGATALGTASLSISGSHNVAQLTFAGLLGGTHTITASYNGDSNYTASTSSALTETVNPASSTVTVGANPNPGSFGQAVVLTATVVPSVSGTLATGTVTFFDGSSSLGTANLSNNGAQISVANFALGSHSITAHYAGDRNFTGSTSAALTEVVNPAATATVVTSSANPSLVNSNVTFTATVTSSIAGTQSGQVSFYLDGSSTAAATVNLSNGAAKYSTNSLSAGNHSVVAGFASTNANFSGSTSAAFTQFVSDFTIAVSPSSLTVARSTSGTYTLTVTPVGDFSGTVSLSCGGVPGGTTCAISPTQVTLSGSGSAQATVTITAAQNASKGTHTLTFTGTSGGLNHKVTANLTIN